MNRAVIEYALECKYNTLSGLTATARDNCLNIKCTLYRISEERCYWTLQYHPRVEIVNWSR